MLILCIHFSVNSLDKFFLEAGNAAQFDSNVNIKDALYKLRLPDMATPLPGMQITLMPHQVIGVAWMLEKEKGVNKGGLMCDEMGLGKVRLSPIFDCILQAH